MKISEQWLRQWANPKLDSAALVERLTMAGLEVDGVEPVAPVLDKIVVGKILEVMPHPNADRLRLTRVDVGKSRPLAIVCGAANAAAGLKVPVALVGARLPGDIVIKEAKVRGEPSSGMLCAAAELGLEESSDGLLVLDSEAKTGQSIVEHLGLDDQAIEIDLTPNRGDCLSVVGIARELSALTGVKLKAPEIRPVRAKSNVRVKVSLKAKAACPRYIGRIIEGIDPAARTPLWMRERLRRSGLRAIHPVVDVTNYVMMELGQPMHAFDRARLKGGIVVRTAKDNEPIELLDGATVKLDKKTLVIADSSRAIAVAGIMGGADSAVGEATTDIVLESAFFAPEAIAGRARALGLHTDSSHRFERGVDPELQRRAIERATQLILEIAGGTPGPVVEEKSSSDLPKRRAIKLRVARAERVLGMSLNKTKIKGMLARLGMEPKAIAGGFSVKAPSFRFDINIEEDLIEEIARITGYDELPVRKPLAHVAPGFVPEGVLAESRVRSLMIDRDFQEIVSYSFVDPALRDSLDPEHEARALANPISADMAVMRTNLWPGLVQTVIYNQNRQLDRVRIFEVGKRFRLLGKDVREERVIAGAIYGSFAAEQWGIKSRAVDFYDLKGDVEAILSLTGALDDFSFVTDTHPALHPGQTARIERKSESAGWIGALHPALLDKLGLDAPVYVFEIEMAVLAQVCVPKFSEISRYPSIKRDLSIIFDESVESKSIMQSIRQHAGDLLVNLELFDVYRGEGIDSGRKSLTMGLTLQDFSRTLKEETVDELIERVVLVLGREHGGVLRQ